MPVAFKNSNNSSSLRDDEPDANTLEAGRLATFDDSWPHPDDSKCCRLNMARAGFYYTGQADCVKCFVCQVKLDDWDPNVDQPWIKHIELSRDCLFAKFGKEQGDLTVEQLLEIACSQAINLVEKKFTALLETTE